MKLIALIIKEYEKLFFNEVFNFSDEYKIKIEWGEVPHVEIIANPDHIRDFYSSSIYNISPIVGNNGTGKTTLLNLIGSLLAERTNFLNAYSYLVVFEKDGEFYFEANRFSATVQVQERGCFPSTISDSENCVSKTDAEKRDLVSFYTPSDFVNYIPKDYTYYEIGKVDDPYKCNGSLAALRSIKDSEIVELDSQIRSFNFLEKKDFFRDDVNLIFRITSLNRDQILNRIKSRFGYAHQELSRRFSGEFSVNSRLQMMIVSFFTEFVIEILPSVLNDEEIVINDKDIKIILEELFNQGSVRFTLSSFEDKIWLINEQLQHIDSSIPMDLEEYLRLVRDLIGCFEEKIKVNELDDSSVIAFEDDEESRSLIKAYLKVRNFKINENTIFRLDNLFFRVLPLNSTGEQNFVNLLSRIYEIIDKSVSKNNIVLVDEIDEGLHIEWSRRLVRLLIDFLEKSTEHKDKVVQLIFSTHSPFILSDVKPGNAIILELQKDRTVKQKETNTFAKNIQEIMFESMGSYEPNIYGEFAHSKIKYLIKKLGTGQTENSDDRDENQKLINMIGEPILKGKLQEMFDQKYLTEVEKIEEMIKRAKLSDGDMEILLNNLSNSNN